MMRFIRGKKPAFKVRDILLARDPQYYQKIGALGGRARVKKGFGLMDKEKLRQVGAKGGRRSRKP